MIIQYRIGSTSYYNYDSTRKNGKKRVDNTSGVAGVCWQKGNGKWYARIKSQGIYINLGCYDTLEEAKSARLAAEKMSGSLYRCNSNN